MDQEELINTIKELKDKLSDPKALVSNPVAEFEKLAKGLMKNFQIKKGDKQLYWMTDIEFYIYTDSHRDIITYPRNCEAGMWFFHASGVDISFKSEVRIEQHPKSKKRMPYLDKTAVFGGILIRGIIDSDSALPVNGPMNVCDALFDQFNALDAPNNFPQIKEVSIPRNVQVVPDKKGRYGLNNDPEKKVKSILYNYSGIDESYITRQELIAAYKEYFDAKYHFLAVPTA